MCQDFRLQGALVKADIEFDVLPVYPNEREECMSVHICRQAGSEQSAIDACDVDARVNRPSMPMGRSQEDSSTINGLGGCRGEMWKSEVPVPAAVPASGEAGHQEDWQGNGPLLRVVPTCILEHK